MAEQRIQYTEEMVGYGHPTKADTLNRLALVDHGTDGQHTLSGFQGSQFAADAGANDTYVITLDPVPAAYFTGMMIVFTANTANTGAATINVNSLGAKAIKKQKDVALSDGDIKAGQTVVLVYDGTNFQLVNPPSALTITGGTNTFNLTNGTASLDVAAGKTVNIDDDVTVAAELHVEAATHVNQDLTSDASPTFVTVKCSGLTDGYIPKHTADATGLENTNLYSDGNNVGLAQTTFGTSADHVFAAASGTAPTTSPADAAQLWVEDYNGAGTARFCMRDEEGNSGPIAFLSDTQPFYGVTWDESADTYSRTGSLAGYKTGAKPPDAVLSIQRRMRGCVVADDGTVNYYLCATDWTKKEDGATASDLTGTDGQVMVEIPKFWYRYGYSGTTHTWEVSPVPLTGFKVHEAFMSDDTEKDYLYFGAYEACLYDVSASKYVGQCYQTSVSAVFATSDDSITIATRTGWATALAVGQKLVITGTTNNNATVTVKTIESAIKITVDENLTDETAAATVIETQTDVTDTTGDKLCSVSGVCPITGGSANGTRAHFRTWAENRGGGKAANDAASFQWSQEYGDALAALQLLYLTEYASFYSQSVLGYGIAAVSDWPAYNDNNPIAKTGNGNAIGNASGNTATSAITTGAGATSVYLKYRGIENLYGHIWKFIDGYKVNNNIPYLCNNFANFSDAESTANYTNPTDVNGAAITMHNANGYQGTLELTGRAFMPASLTGGDASAKITDYYYQAAGWCVVISGGHANFAANAGAFFLDAYSVLAYVNRYFGGRLVGRK